MKHLEIVLYTGPLGDKYDEAFSEYGVAPGDIGIVRKGDCLEDVYFPRVNYGIGIFDANKGWCPVFPSRFTKVGDATEEYLKACEVFGYRNQYGITGE